MKKLLKVSDWLILGIGGFLDALQEIKDPLNLISNYYSSFYGRVPNRFQKQNFYRAIWRSLKTGDMEKIVEKGKVFLKLTSAGYQKIVRKFPFLRFQNKRWDRKWRLVIFDIEEAARGIRDLFRIKLKELGFAQLQKSVWITPHDVLADFKEFIEANNLGEKVILIETGSLYGGDPKIIAEKLWSISKINEKYIDVYNELIQLQEDNQKYYEKHGGRSQFLNQLKTKVINLYLEDPYLPKELLPSNWYAPKVMAMVRKLKIFS